MLQAIQILSWLSKYKPKTLVKHKMVGPILAVMCPILAEPDTRNHEDEVAPEHAAAEVLDTMAMNLPKKHIFPPVLHFSVSNCRNPDPNYRDAAVMALGVISEGCFEVMKTRLEEVLALVLEALKDKEQVVRGAASFALGQFAEHLQPEINEYYERVLPCIFTVLSDPVPEVQVDRFCFYLSVQSPSSCWRFSTQHNCNGQKGVAKGFHWLGSIMKKFNEFFCRKRLSIHLQHFVRT
jgi:hypothetical protein